MSELKIIEHLAELPVHELVNLALLCSLADRLPSHIRTTWVWAERVRMALEWKQAQRLKGYEDEAQWTFV